jgi:hypothetical protein
MRHLRDYKFVYLSIFGAFNANGSLTFQFYSLIMLTFWSATDMTSHSLSKRSCVR